ncbi:hypothetical protein [Silvanigrella aquatica]|uniref:Fibronectin type-III domain-containing protein n=1 Tax=Silvanigrella aquatica TaxID=1915309 RepID=A0A1L4D0S4_9BACT|nr:hypothetical protein [Silvanigrella aquatica]APJ03780.1 hypothetical protein AXG55_07620 [Silvanigrella aquatica]
MLKQNYKNLFNDIAKMFLIAFMTIIHNFCFSNDGEYIKYKVEKYDILENILYYHELVPIYGKNGSLEKFLKLNPTKHLGKGNLIYPGEIITLPKSLKKSNNYERKNYEFSSSFINYQNKELNEDLVYIIYKVQKNDMISMLLQAFKSSPIYGKYGKLSKTLDLNPKKRKTHGDLIYPNEFIILPIKINVLLSLSDSQKNNIKIIKRGTNINEINNIDNQITFDELQKKSELDLTKKKEEIEIERFSREKEENDKKLKLSMIQKFSAHLEKGNVVLKWDGYESKNKFSYEIKRSLESKNKYFSIAKNLTKNSYIDQNVMPNTKYYYTLVIHEFPNKVTRSEEISITSGFNTIKLSAKLVKNYALLEWSTFKDPKNKGGLKFTVMRSDSCGKDYTKIAENISITKFKDQEIQKGSVYCYQIIAFNSSGESELSNEAFINTPLLNTNLKIKFEDNILTLFWDKSKGNIPIKYEIFRSLANKENFESLDKNINENEYIDFSAQKGFKYFYKLRTHYESSGFTDSNIVSIIMNPEKPHSIFAKLTFNNEVIIEWKKSINESDTTYEIMTSFENDKNFKKAGETYRKNSFVDTNAKPGMKIYYYVTAINNAGKKSDSEVVSIITAPNAPKNLRGVLDKNQIILNWDDVPSNTDIKYEVRRSQISCGEYETIESEITTSEYADLNINPEEKYYYVVIAKTKGGKSHNSNEISIQSHLGEHLPSSLRTTLGVRYLTLKETNLQRNSTYALNSVASPSILVDHIHNWQDNFITFIGGGVLYLDMMQSPIYIMPNRQFYLFEGHFGAEYQTPMNIYLRAEMSLDQEIVYQSVGYNTMQDQSVYISDLKFLVGYTFFTEKNLKAQAEGAFILSSPLSYQINNFGLGYEGAIKVSQQNSAFDIGGRLYYSNRNIIAPNVKSNIIEYGIMGQISIELGNQ